MEDCSFPSTSVVRGLSWLYSSFLHLAPGIRLLVLHFSSMPCFVVVSIFMKTKYVARVFLHFFSLNVNLLIVSFFSVFGALSF